MSNKYLRFWGVRGSYAAPFDSHLKVGGNTSCVEISADGHTLICDAGTGVIPLGNELVKGNARELMLLLTHYHWDHVCGLPFFVPAFLEEWTINFFGPGNDMHDVEKHVSAQMKAPYFPVGTESWLAKINYVCPNNDTLQHGPMKITFRNVHHPGATFGYRICVNGKTVIYISDNECKFIEKSVSKQRSELNHEEQSLYDDMIREEHQSELEIIRNADILIHDAQYTTEDYNRKRGWGHSCYIDTVNMAIDAGVKELYLYHHDPNYDDEMIDGIHQHALDIISDRKSNLKCHVAREGLRVDL
ncbi:MAG TPA: MBL fold metallo-hydrolase [Gammaproteobacteria bacterium]